MSRLMLWQTIKRQCCVSAHQSSEHNGRCADYDFDVEVLPFKVFEEHLSTSNSSHAQDNNKVKITTITVFVAQLLRL